MRLRLELALTVALCAFTALPGCDETELRPYAQDVVFDLTTHKFTCLRQFKSDLNGKHVEYVERVRSAGNGKDIVVELDSLNGKKAGLLTDPTQRAAFKRFADTLATGGGARALFQRDARIDSLDRMAENYFITLIEVGREPIRPGGEPSLTFKIEPKVQDRPFYVLTVSTAAGREGFPLECQEYSYGAGGPLLVSDMQVLDPLLWNDSGGEVAPAQQPISLRTDISSLLDARLRAREAAVTLLLPQNGSLPSGFELVQIEQVTINTTANDQHAVRPTTLFRFVYSDGVERIEFIEHSPLDSIPPVFTGPGANDLVMLETFGTLSIATLVHNGTQVVIESRIASDRFHALMKSLVPL